MKRQITSVIMAISMFAGLLITAGCETKAQSGALIGTGVGALAGQAIGGNTTGTLIGAGAGAVGGYLVGRHMDKSDEKKEDKAAQEAKAAQAAAETETVWVTNTNGSQIPVKLTKDGAGFIGPRGERYDTMPTQDQLRSVYGF